MCVCRRPEKQIVPQGRVLHREDCRVQAVITQARAIFSRMPYSARLPSSLSPGP